MSFSVLLDLENMYAASEKGLHFVGCSGADARRDEAFRRQLAPGCH